MFKVRAGSVEEYVHFDPAVPGMTMTMIGYGQYRYTVKSSPAPVI